MAPDSTISLGIDPKDINSLEQAQKALLKIGTAAGLTSKELSSLNKSVEKAVRDLDSMSVAKSPFAAMAANSKTLASHLKQANKELALSAKLNSDLLSSRGLTDNITDTKSLMLLQQQLNEEMEKQARLKAQFNEREGTSDDAKNLAIAKELNRVLEKRALIKGWDTDQPKLDRFSAETLKKAESDLRSLKQEIKELGPYASKLSEQFDKVEASTRKLQGGVPTKMISDLKEAVRATKDLSEAQAEANTMNRAFDKSTQLKKEAAEMKKHEKILREQVKWAEKLDRAHRQAIVENKGRDRATQLKNEQQVLKGIGAQLKKNTAELKEQRKEADKLADAHKQAYLENKKFDNKVKSRAEDIGAKGLSTAEIRKYKAELESLQKQISKGVASGKTSAELNKLITRYDKLSRRVKIAGKEVNNFNKYAQVQHGIIRGLAGGLGKLWMSYGAGAAAIGAMGAAYAVTRGFIELTREFVTVGADFEYTTQYVYELNRAAVDASGGIEALRKSLVEAKGVFQTPGELAEGLRELVRAGVDVDTAMKALPAVSNLATVGMIDVAEATKLTVTAFNAFKKDGNSMEDVANIIAKTAHSSATSIGELGTALSYTTELSKIAGMSLEEVAAALGVMANIGIKGSKSGTALRTSLVRLLAPTSKLSEAMRGLGMSFTAFGADGAVKKFGPMMKDLANSMKDLQAGTKVALFKEMFGLRAMKGGVAIVDAFIASMDGSVNSYEEMLAKIKDSGGELARIFDGLEKTVKGQALLLKKAWESVIADSFTESTSSELAQALEEIRKVLESDEFGEAADFFAESMADAALAIADFLANNPEAVADAILTVGKAAGMAYKTLEFFVDGLSDFIELRNSLGDFTDSGNEELLRRLNKQDRPEPPTVAESLDTDFDALITDMNKERRAKIKEESAKTKDVASAATKEVWEALSYAKSEAQQKDLNKARNEEAESKLKLDVVKKHIKSESALLSAHKSAKLMNDKQYAEESLDLKKRAYDAERDYISKQLAAASAKLHTGIDVNVDDVLKVSNLESQLEALDKDWNIKLQVDDIEAKARLKEVHDATEELNFNSLVSSLQEADSVIDNVEGSLMQLERQAKSYLSSQGVMFDSGPGKRYFKALVEESRVFENALGAIQDKLRGLNNDLEDTKFDFARDLQEERGYRSTRDKYAQDKAAIAELIQMGKEAGEAGTEGRERQLELLEKAYNLTKSLDTSADTDGLKAEMERAKATMEEYSGSMSSLKRDSKNEYLKAKSEYEQSKTSGADEDLQANKIATMKDIQKLIIENKQAAIDAQEEEKEAVKDKFEEMKKSWESVDTALSKAKEDIGAYGVLIDLATGKVYEHGNALRSNLLGGEGIPEPPKEYKQQSDGKYTNAKAEMEGFGKVIDETSGKVVKLGKKEKERADDAVKNSKLVKDALSGEMTNVADMELPKIKTQLELEDDAVNRILAEVDSEFERVGLNSDETKLKLDDMFKEATEAADDYYFAIDDNIDIIRDFGSTAVAEINKVIEAQRELNAEAAKFKPASGSIPGKALGGPVTGGQPYIVGEVGKELFIPNTSGTIVPNNKLGSYSGGKRDSVDLNINLGGQQMPTIEGATKSSVDSFITELERTSRLAA